MRYLLLALPILLAQAPAAQAQVIVGGSVQAPGIGFSLNLASAPQMVQVPGYPVYVAPEVNANLFFYSGRYWAFQNDQWYASPGYDGPWRYVALLDVPAFVLRVPVNYYRAPPPYFVPWHGNAAPHWGEHWGRRWEGKRADWNQWDRSRVPRAVPPPAHQRDQAANWHRDDQPVPRQMYTPSDRLDRPDRIERQPIEQRRFDRGQDRFDRQREDGREQDRR